MDLNNFTIKAQEAVQKAQELAVSAENQAIETGHLLKGILLVDEDIVSFAIKKVNVNLDRVGQALDAVLSSYSKVSGVTKNYISNDADRALIKAKKFMKELMPKNTKNIKKYRGKIPLFHDANIEKELNNIYEPTVKLKSGGYLVINPTEALVAIDINSGQSTKQINIEKTALNTNLEAAEEIARQIKLRDLSGLIVVDFIDMVNFYNRRTVEKKMRESIKKDRARIQIGKISNFGLLEMTRQRLREGSIKWETQLSLASFSQKILKKIQHLAFTDKVKIINSYVPEKVKIYIEKNLLDELKYFQKKYAFEVKILSNDKFIIPEYKINLLNKSKVLLSTIENISSIVEIKKIKENSIIKKKGKNKSAIKSKDKTKKTKTKKKIKKKKKKKRGKKKNKKKKKKEKIN